MRPESPSPAGEHRVVVTAQQLAGLIQDAAKEQDREDFLAERGHSNACEWDGLATDLLIISKSHPGTLLSAYPNLAGNVFSLLAQKNLGPVTAKIYEDLSIANMDPDGQKTTIEAYSIEAMRGVIQSAIKKYTREAIFTRFHSLRDWAKLAEELNTKNAERISEDDVSKALALTKKYPPKDEESMLSRVIRKLGSTPAKYKAARDKQTAFTLLLASTSPKEFAEKINTAAEEYIADKITKTSRPWKDFLLAPASPLLEPQEQTLTPRAVSEVRALLIADKRQGSVAHKLLSRLYVRNPSAVPSISELSQLLGVSTLNSDQLFEIIDTAIKTNPKAGTAAAWENIKAKLKGSDTLERAFSAFDTAEPAPSSFYLDDMLDLFANLGADQIARTVLTEMGGAPKQFETYARFKMRLFLHSKLAAATKEPATFSLPEGLVYRILFDKYSFLIATNAEAKEWQGLNTHTKTANGGMSSSIDEAKAYAIAGQILEDTVVHPVKNNALRYIFSAQFQTIRNIEARVNAAWAKLIVDCRLDCGSAAMRKLETNQDARTDLENLLINNEALIDAALIAFDFGFQRNQTCSQSVATLDESEKTALISMLLTVAYEHPRSFAQKNAMSKEQFEESADKAYRSLAWLRGIAQELPSPREVNQKDLQKYLDTLKAIFAIKSWVFRQTEEWKSPFNSLIQGVETHVNKIKTKCENDNLADSHITSLAALDQNLAQGFLNEMQRAAHHTSAQNIREWLDRTSELCESKKAALAAALESFNLKFAILTELASYDDIDFSIQENRWAYRQKAPEVRDKLALFSAEAGKILERKLEELNQKQQLGKKVAGFLSILTAFDNANFSSKKSRDEYTAKANEIRQELDAFPKSAQDKIAAKLAELQAKADQGKANKFLNLLSSGKVKETQQLDDISEWLSEVDLPTEISQQLTARLAEVTANLTRAAEGEATSPSAASSSSGGNKERSLSDPQGQFGLDQHGGSTPYLHGGTSPTSSEGAPVFFGVEPKEGYAATSQQPSAPPAPGAPEVDERITQLQLFSQMKRNEGAPANRKQAQALARALLGQFENNKPLHTFLTNVLVFAQLESRFWTKHRKERRQAAFALIAAVCANNGVIDKNTLSTVEYHTHKPVELAGGKKQDAFTLFERKEIWKSKNRTSIEDLVDRYIAPQPN